MPDAPELGTKSPAAADPAGGYGALVSEGIAAASRGDGAAAVAAYRAAIAAAPQRPEAHVNLAAILHDNGSSALAEVHCRLALATRPDMVPALVNRGAALINLGRLTEARGALERALELAPDEAGARQNLALACREMGDTDAAREHFVALQAHQASPGLRVQAEMLLPPIPASVEDLRSARARFEDGVARLHKDKVALHDPAKEVGQTPFYLAYHGEDDIDIQRRIAEFYRAACPALSFVAPHCRPRRRPPSGVPAGERRIRVGFISSYFTAHTIGQLQRGLIAGLDRRRFEVVVFAFGSPDSAIARQIHGCADRTVILPRRLEAAQAALAEARLDALLFTDLGMDPQTYFLAHGRYAPVQATTWGHPITTGLPSIDFFLTSALMEEPAAQAHYSETLVRLPGLSVHYQRPPAPDPWPLSRWGLPEDRTVYLCPQSLFKFHPAFDTTFADILRNDARGLLVLVNAKIDHWGTLLMERFRRVAPDVADRIVLLPKQPYDAFLRLMQAAPVMLDTWPFGGGNTTLEALAMGTPVVTLPDTHLRGRLTLGFYRRMESEDLVAASADAYVGLALRLGGDPDARAQARERIAARSGRLFEDTRTLEDMGRFFEQSVVGNRVSGTVDSAP